MAADGLGTTALAALGVDSLSVAVNQFAATRQVLAGLDAQRLVGLREALLTQRTTREVRGLLEGWGREPS